MALRRQLSPELLSVLILHFHFITVNFAPWGVLSRRCVLSQLQENTLELAEILNLVVSLVKASEFLGFKSE